VNKSTSGKRTHKVEEASPSIFKDSGIMNLVKLNWFTRNRNKLFSWPQILLASIVFLFAGYLIGALNSDSKVLRSGDLTVPNTKTLTESQLFDSALKSGREVYWAGPDLSDKYLFDGASTGASFVTYLSSGSGEDISNSKNRVIATYYREDGFQATVDAGKLDNGISILGQDDTSVIYYNSSLPTNVYVAFKNLPYQIEIYDPQPGQALAIASEIGRIRPIK